MHTGLNAQFIVYKNLARYFDRILTFILKGFLKVKGKDKNKKQPKRKYSNKNKSLLGPTGGLT